MASRKHGHTFQFVNSPVWGYTFAGFYPVPSLKRLSVSRCTIWKSSGCRCLYHPIEFGGIQLQVLTLFENRKSLHSELSLPFEKYGSRNRYARRKCSTALSSFSCSYEMQILSFCIAPYDNRSSISNRSVHLLNKHWYFHVFIDSISFFNIFY